MDKIKVVIADDQILLRDSMKTIINMDESLEVVAAAANGLEAVNLVEMYHPQVVLMDIRMPVMDGVESIKIIKTKFPEVKVIMLTTFNDEKYIIEALAHGASGYLLKDIEIDKLIKTLKDAAAGQTILPNAVAAKLAEGLSKLSHNKKAETDVSDLDFSEREKEISSMMVQGFTNKQISMALYISEGTVRNYISSIYSKINISDRTQAVLYLKEKGIR
jgi:DNA-binding NarL/FixJ family response regulator